LCYLECHRERLEVGLVAALVLGGDVVAAIAMGRNQMPRLSKVIMEKHIGVNLPMVMDMMVRR
jgi:hypothetical protein